MRKQKYEPISIWNSDHHSYDEEKPRLDFHELSVFHLFNED